MPIDTHAHLNFRVFDKDRDEVIKKCLENNLWIINIGINYETSKRVAEIAEEYPQGVFAAIGLHPTNLDTGLIKIGVDEIEREYSETKPRNEIFTSRSEQSRCEPKQGSYLEKDFNYKKYKELGKSSRVVAIGEIGLDYYRKPKTKLKLELFKQKQRKVFLEQLELAKELNLPVIFHCRMAHQDLIEIFNFQFSIFDFRGVIHCFTGNWEQAKKYLEMGLYLGFNGIIFKLKLDEIIKKMPLERILLETDSPYLTPSSAVALAKTGSRNEPLNVKYIAQRIAKIKNISYEKVIKVTTQNARDLFNI